MNISKRQSEILKILETNMYVSVNELSKLTYTSPSSIRRDLSHLEDLGLVNRSYGGVALPEMSGRVAGFYNRTTKNIKEKIEFFRMMWSANFEKWQKLSFF